MFVPVPPGRDHDHPSIPPDVIAAIDPRTEQELRAFVGSNDNYYLRAWRPALTGQGHITRVHVAAFFFPIFWLGYRKMYRLFGILVAVYIAEYLVELRVFVAVLRLDEPPWGPGILVGLIVALVCGLCANRWYLSHARRGIARLQAYRLDESAYLRELSRCGGTSILAPFLLLMSFCVGGAILVELLLAFVLRRA
jgi:hypothetical protein